MTARHQERVNVLDRHPASNIDWQFGTGLVKVPPPHAPRSFLMHNHTIAVALALTLAACDGSGTTPSGGGGSGGAGGVGGAGGDTTGGAPAGGQGAGFTGESFSVTFDPVTVPAGEEDTKCVVKKLSNPAAIHVGQIHNELGPGSHHLIVYRTDDTEEITEPFSCQPFSDLLDPSKGTPLMITQKADDLLVLPQGVAFAIGQEQFVRLEMHYLNPTGAPLEVTATSTFYEMDEASFEHEADFLFFGNPDIDIPPNSSATLGPTFLPLPANLSESKFFGLTGHTHQFGTNVTVATSDTATGAQTLIYDVGNWQWEEPETVYLEPALEIPDGGGFHLTCEWNNTSSQNVQFGESANAEMCFFWTYYYPSKGAFVCAHTDQVPGGFDLCCPGSPFCDQLF